MNFRGRAFFRRFAQQNMKKTIAPKKMLAPSEVRPTPHHEEISKRARELWEKYERPSGRDEEIWLEAERQLLGGDSIGAKAEPAFGMRTG